MKQTTLFEKLEDFGKMMLEEHIYAQRERPEKEEEQENLARKW